MTPQQLQQIAGKVKDSLLSSLDWQIDSAARDLGIEEEISDEEWQELVDLILC